MKLKINNVYNQDCFKFLTEVDNNCIDLVIADPPYNLKMAYWDSFSNLSEFLNFNYKWIDSVLPKIKKTGSIYIFNTPFNCAFLLKYLLNKNLIFQNWITWYKKDGFNASKKKYANNQEILLFFTVSEKYTFNSDAIRTPYLSTNRINHAQKKGILKNGKRWYPNPKGKLCTDVWEFSSQRHKEKIHGKVKKLAHPTTKPSDLIERIVLASSNPNDLILDLFSGLGTTSIVSKKLNRNFIGCENNAKYIKEINRRLKNVLTKSN